MPATIMKDTAAPQGNTNKQAAPTILVPFTRASHEHLEPMKDVSEPLTATSIALGPYDVPAYGYLRSIVLDVQASGGAGTGVTAKEDAPWSVISEIALIDVNGAPVVGPFSGYDLYLINKYGGYSYASDPKQSPMYSPVGATSGNFRFCLRVPVEFSAREGLGALPNANAASTWKLRITLNPAAEIYGTAPATLPTVRVRMHLDAWSQPAQTDLKGNATAQQPPAIGTTAYWSKTTLPVSAGFNTLRLPRMGSLLRELIFVYRNSSGSRSAGDTAFPDTPSLYWDTRLLKTYQKELWKHELFRKTGFSAAAEAANGLDLGVYVEDYAHDFDGKIGGELRDQYLGTTQSTRYELTGTFSSAGTLTVITNDVAAASEIFVN
ncbi:hypothetical protein GCM10010387_67470 [Streptomyces inusitatus]|uniref:Uncharacterized protein n=1 Tax=Streptomyces inusitatus TaxID=68221 RepID=A0A918QSI4_9ACTN|nr:hypothetical protein [Streptomyces inusitatus]GGZ64894.1 hypothetical protein GCM10010387_67470 [Streptomyces inusitatus]